MLTTLLACVVLAAVPGDEGSPAKVKRAASPQTLAAAQMILEQRVPQGMRGGPAAAGSQNTQNPEARNAASLIDLIQSTIAPASWDVRGGQGSIMYFSPGGNLVVRQTGETHQAVGAALQQMRGH